jgi:hypothetical protein
MSLIKKLICQTIVFIPFTALADDLPNELLLRCDVKQTSIIESAGKPDFNEVNLSKDFRLKNGVFAWTNGPVPVGVDCRLVDGEIACKWSGIIPPQKNSPLGIRTEKRQSSVRLSRATGEIKLVLETWGYPGDGVKGSPDISMKMTQSGVCRTIGKAIF